MKDFTLTYPEGQLTLHRCRIMGILNVTPDSFSDGGQFESAEDAVNRAWDMVDEGADILDIGAQSSRPGADTVGQEEEISRLEPVLQSLHEDQYPIPISLDTYKPEVLSCFAQKKWIQIANDITGLRNEHMVEIVRAQGLPVIAMHMFGMPQTMQDEYHYENVVEDLLAYFRTIMEKYDLYQNIVFDPGIGFGKSVAHNLEIIDRLSEFHQLEAPILLGASRKSFIGKSLNLEVQDRLEPSLAVAAMAVDRGCQILRVHDVLETKKIIQMVEKVKKYQEPSE